MATENVPTGWVHTWLKPLYLWLLGLQAAVDGLLGASFEPFRVMTAASLPTYVYAPSPAFTMTASANGALVVDGITLEEGDRFWNQNGAAGSDEGGYVLTQQGDDDTPWIATRSSDADASGDFTQGKQIVVEEGTTNGGTEWTLTNASFTLDTTTPTIAEGTGSAHLGNSTTSVAPAFTPGGTAMAETLTGFTGTTSGKVTTITAGGAAVAANALAGGVAFDGTTESRIISNTALTATSGTITTVTGLASVITATGDAWVGSGTVASHTHVQT